MGSFLWAGKTLFYVSEIYNIDSHQQNVTKWSKSVHGKCHITYHSLTDLKLGATRLISIVSKPIVFVFVRFGLVQLHFVFRGRFSPMVLAMVSFRALGESMTCSGLG